ncbi:MAG: class I SAM-dependent methyltransferase [Candidatus Thorarchaeota archaeon]|jgi:ubiquinone/menaquinone biosynthesis C-methylase UbiE
MPDEFNGVLVMRKPLLKFIRCPKCHKGLLITENESDDEIEKTTLACEKGHTWAVKDGIPSLVFPALTKEDAKWIAEYDEMAENYDELVKQYDEFLGVEVMKEREKLVQFIPIEGPVKILDVSVGTAANFVALHSVFNGKQMRRFNLHGLDLSRGMLGVSKRKMNALGLEVSLIHGSVFNIPYKDKSFDIVNHSGGINTFSDIPKAFNEMLRVVAPGGTVIVNDEGLSPEMRKTEKGKAIIEANSLFAARPPLEHIPDKAKNVEVEYILNGTFYQIVFRK